jgi:periodic tryptophan protein 2
MSGVLLHKYTVSVNLSLEGTQEFLNSKNLTEGGPAGMIDTSGEASDLEDRMDNSLPGAKRGDAASRRIGPEVRVPGVNFAPTGRSFCAASTEGLLVYSLDTTIAFDPFDLDIDITPQSTLKTLAKKQYLKALVMAFRLNNPKLVARIQRSVPAADIPLVVSDLPVVYLPRLLSHIAVQSDASPLLELNLLWLQALLKSHGAILKKNQGEYAEVTRLVQRAVSRIQKEIFSVAENNEFMVEYLLAQPVRKQQDGLKMLQSVEDGAVKEIEMADDDDDEDGEDGWIGLED